MLLDFDEQQLRASLATWQEALNMRRPALAGPSSKDHADSLARVDQTLAGCLAVLQACTSADEDIGAMRSLQDELQELRQWIRETRCALDVIAHAQR